MENNCRKVTVRALGDFCVGPFSSHVAIEKGETRNVVVDFDGDFNTLTKDGCFFGTCNVNSGWEIVEEEKKEEEISVGPPSISRESVWNMIQAKKSRLNLMNEMLPCITLDSDTFITTRAIRDELQIFVYDLEQLLKTAK